MAFQRVLKLLSLLLGLVTGLSAVIVAFFTRRMIAPTRQPLWTTPSQMGLAYENVQFPALDSVRLSGWFVPADSGAQVRGNIILAHDWLWNRLGDAADDLGADLSGISPIELLRLTHALHYEGYNVLMFDIRNHGESASHPPVTFGLSESSDLLGALAYLQTRADVDPERIGVIGFGMGANALLYALPQTDQIRAGVAVQPSTPSIYADGYATDSLNLLGKILLGAVKGAYSAISNVRLDALQPSFAAAGAGDTPVLFVQSKGDKWGSAEDVNRLCQATPGGEGPIYVNGNHHYRGFQYIIDNPRPAMVFFEEHMN